MSKHTDITERMTKRIKDQISSHRDYNYVLTISEPKNKDQAVRDEIRYRMNNVTSYADRRGYKVECVITAPPPTLLKYNCVGCRARKSGDYFWVTAKLTPKDNKEDGSNYYPRGWDQPLAKVCSKECGELMILRIA